MEKNTNFYCRHSGVGTCCEKQCGYCTLKVEETQAYTKKLVAELKTMQEDKIKSKDRNSKENLKFDIDFLINMSNALEENDIHYLKTMIIDWKKELQKQVETISK